MMFTDPTRFPGERTNAMILLRRSLGALGIALLAGLAVPAHAEADADAGTRLVRCHEQQCLLVTGHRDNAATMVHINGHAVKAEGERRWRVRVPVATVRDWSAPFARTIEVTLRDSDTQQGTTERAKLPIGLMGHADLASLIISLH